jgi:hypothetical protein
MTYFATRLCKYKDKGETTYTESTLAELRQTSAYVLLGDPGMGKTIAFEKEAVESQGKYVTARDLLKYSQRSEYQKTTLFIDGLDEIRAGATDARAPFDELCSILEKLGRPKFRLSCREADWLGQNDFHALTKVAPHGELLELHLQPLTEKDIHAILTNNYSNEVVDPTAFIAETKQKGLSDLAKNPQLLKMLVEAVAEKGNWPTSTKETLELACKKMTAEHNPEHTAASRNQPKYSTEAIIDRAGFLCALILLTGKAGFALTPTASNPEYPDLDNLDTHDSNLLHRTCKSKLFTVAHDQATYCHRLVAEYLAARHLSKLVDDKQLPLRRLLSVLTSTDGIAVSELRGLYAWLAALCQSGRKALLQKDPLRVVLYGDVKLFTAHEKQCLLQALSKEAEQFPAFRNENWIAHPFGALATAEIQPVFKEILAKHGSRPAQQAILGIVLDALTYGEKLTDLLPELEAIIQDDSCGSHIRATACKLMLRYLKDTPQYQSKAIQLARDLKDNRLNDTEDELLGLLLTSCYPERITPAQVFDFYHPPKTPNFIGKFQNFWSSALIKRSSDEQISAFLDSLAARKFRLPIKDSLNLQSMIFGALQKGLESYGATIEPERLISWLSLCLSHNGYFAHHYRTETNTLREWLQQHPETQRRVIETFIDSSTPDFDFNICRALISETLLRCERPKDYGKWCLAKAKKEAEPQKSKYYFLEAMHTLESNHDASNSDSIDILAACKEKHNFNEWRTDFLRYNNNHQAIKEIHEINKKYQTEQQQEKEKRLEDAKQHIEIIRSGKANIGYMADLAMRAPGSDYSHDSDRTIDALYQNDQALITAAKQGLRNFLFNTESHPTLAVIYETTIKNQSFHAASVVLTGLHLLHEESQNEFLHLEDPILKLGLAFYFVNTRSAHPPWFCTLLTQRISLVTDSLISFTKAMIKGKQEHIGPLYYLATDPPWLPLAEEAALPLLREFPPRCTHTQLAPLRLLLESAQKQSKRQDFLALIEHKRQLKSMDTAQRLYWLVIGYLLSPRDYEATLLHYLDKNPRHIENLAAILCPSDTPSQLNLSVEQLRLLIEVLGPAFKPPYFESPGAEEDEITTIASNARYYIRSLVQKLGGLPTQEAAEQLSQLIQKPELQHWKLDLQAALHTQQGLQREAEFHHPSIEQVIALLRNQAPTNAGDLAALAVDHIRQVAKAIKDGNNDPYKSFWNTDGHGKPTTRKHEDNCRDVFIGLLRSTLPTGVEVQPEDHYARDKRADMKISYVSVNGRYSIPVEVKCNDHKELWYAMHNQLIALYTRDPEAYGYGIYLALWFGNKIKTQSPPQGVAPPQTPEQLEKALLMRLTEAEKQRTSVCVVDCSGQ